MQSINLYILDLFDPLIHWGRVMHICVSKLTIIGSDNGLSHDRCQAIIWTNAGLLLIGPLGTNFSEILIEILTFSFKKMRLKVSSAKRRPFCLGLNMLIPRWRYSRLYNDLLRRFLSIDWNQINQCVYSTCLACIIYSPLSITWAADITCCGTQTT